MYTYDIVIYGGRYIVRRTFLFGLMERYYSYSAETWHTKAAFIKKMEIFKEIYNMEYYPLHKAADYIREFSGINKLLRRKKIQNAIKNAKFEVYRG